MVGGYLVLEQPFAGYVLSTTARFHTRVKLNEQPLRDDTATDVDNSIPLILCSPQFHTTSTIHVGTKAPFAVRTVSGPSPSAFLYQPIRTAFLAGSMVAGAEQLSVYLQSLAQRGYQVEVTLQADNDFYSQAAHVRDCASPLDNA